MKKFGLWLLGLLPLFFGIFALWMGTKDYYLPVKTVSFSNKGPIYEIGIHDFDGINGCSYARLIGGESYESNLTTDPLDLYDNWRLILRPDGTGAAAIIPEKNETTLILFDRKGLISIVRSLGAYGHDIAFSPDGHYLAVGTEIYRVEDWRKIKHLKLYFTKNGWGQEIISAEKVKWMRNWHLVIWPDSTWFNEEKRIVHHPVPKFDFDMSDLSQS